MGQSLFDQVTQYRVVEQQVDVQLGYSLRRLCLEDSSDLLKQTKYAQPALYVVNALHYYKALDAGPRPDFLAGHSLGEYNALLAAGVFDFLTGLRLVQKRGELMSAAVDGGMAAIVGLRPGEIAEVLQDCDLTDIDVANYNSPLQTIVSGPTTSLRRAKGLFERAGARAVIELQVSGAFHSRYMSAAARVFEQFLQSIPLAQPSLPVIANASGQFYPKGDDAHTKSLLVRQISQPVRWQQSVQQLVHRGVQEFIEAGPGGVLTRLIREIQQATTTAPRVTAAGCVA
jgi:malonyl CoA-acyl carrier protein transacylase